MLMLILHQQSPDRPPPFICKGFLWLKQPNSGSVLLWKLIQSTTSLTMNDLLWGAICSVKQERVWYIISHLILGHFLWYIRTWSTTNKCNVKVKMHYETMLLSVRALYVSPSLKTIKGGGWAFALEAAKTCLELLNQQSRRGKQVPLSLSALELKEVFSQLALWIWFPLHQNTSAINNFRHNESTCRSHTLMWQKSFLSMSIVSV